ncbi:MAG: ATP synthase F1 subunit delta [Bacteroidales bacterium]|nr:ATP synthase F1 subunit delta [Bacteroidales bacterium]
MKELRLQGRYAESLYILAEEKNILDKVREDILNIESACKENHEFQVILNNPVIKPAIKKNIINAVFSSCEELTLRFLTFIIEKRRELFLLGICEEFLNIYNLKHNIKVAELTVSDDISLAVTDEIKERLASIFASEIDLRVCKDETLVGGFTLTIDGKQYDASFKRKLADLKKEFLLK